MAEAVSYFRHVCAQGETFDLLAFRYYHEERLADRILQANPDMIDILVFTGGEVLQIPVLTDFALPESLPPWRREA